MNYIDKMIQMLKADYSIEEITENLYLNYSAAIDTDEVYKIRKRISCAYGCDLNEVKLIGSSHTGYTYKKGKLQERNDPKDYDFGIISASTFTKQFHEVCIDKIRMEKKNAYIYNILKGKLHPYYANKDYLEKIERINSIIQKELGVKRHITVCFYLSEQDFISGLVEYSEQLYLAKLKEIKESTEYIDTNIGTAINELDKLEE